MTSAEFSDRYQALKHQYVESLPNRAKELNTAWSRLKHVSWDDKTLAIIERGAHKLAGSGKTFGFPAISDQARELELQIQNLREKSDATLSERKHLEASLQQLTLVIEEAIEGKGKGRAAPVDDAFSNSTNQHQHRIAIIEDDPSLANLLKAWLEARGFWIDLFQTPTAFIESTSDHHQLVLMDVSFPGGAMEGITLLDRVKNKVGQNRPVLMMSTRSDMVARMRALQAGADGYATKPINFGVLETQIDQLMASFSHAKHRVLWVDDDSEQLAFYEALLADQGYEVETLSKPLRLLERIEHFQPDAIVLDHEMPGVKGIELARMLRQDPRFMTIPILFVSASPAVTRHRDTYAMTGNEFFRKPLDNRRFLTALKHHLWQARRLDSRINLVSKRKESQGLLNHDFFLTELNAILASLQTAPDTEHQWLAQVSIDRADYLKAQHGARAMAGLTGRLEYHFSEQLSAGEMGCHLGGGNFLFLLEADSEQDPEAFLKQFHRRFNHPTWTLGKPPQSVTISAGLLLLSQAMNEDTALLEVELACSEAMQAGGNRVMLCKTPEQSGQGKVDDRIRESLEDRSFALHYQPIVNMDSGQTLFEALVRLIGEDRTVFFPNQFMPSISAGHGVSLRELDQWVIQHALGEFSEHGGNASTSHSIAIKLSSPMSEVVNMLPFIRTCLGNRPVGEARGMYLALSMKTVIKDVASAKLILDTLHEMDCGLVIEHVEASDAAVELLRELPSTDFIKLAPQYGSSKAQTTDLKSILDRLSAILGSTQPIVATHVENAKALSWFWERNIRHFQGHFIQAPEVAMKFEL